MPAGGGRVTELVARPLLNLHWPELAGVIQPLAGNTPHDACCSSDFRSQMATASTSRCSLAQQNCTAFAPSLKLTLGCESIDAMTLRDSGGWPPRSSKPHGRGSTVVGPPTDPPARPTKMARHSLNSNATPMGTTTSHDFVGLERPPLVTVSGVRAVSRRVPGGWSADAVGETTTVGFHASRVDRQKKPVEDLKVAGR